MSIISGHERIHQNTKIGHVYLFNLTCLNHEIDVCQMEYIDMHAQILVDTRLKNTLPERQLTDWKETAPCLPSRALYPVKEASFLNRALVR